jgi:hypothetical protein
MKRGEVLGDLIGNDVNRGLLGNKEKEEFFK